MFTCSDVKNLIDKYIKNGGNLIELESGTLGYGTVVLVDTTGKLKQFIIHEIALNEWASTHKITTYAKRGLPKKYEKQLENLGFYRGVDYR